MVGNAQKHENTGNVETHKHENTKNVPKTNAQKRQVNSVKAGFKTKGLSFTPKKCE